MIKAIWSLICPAMCGVFTFWNGNSGGGNTTTTTVNKPPKQVEPYIAPYIERAWGASVQPFETYQGQRVADLTPEQYMSSGMTSAQALNGFQGQSDAMGNFQKTMRGDFMNPDSNPWLAANAQKAMGDITSAYRSGTRPQTDAAYSRSGAFGGSAWMQGVNNNERALADSLGATANQFYGQNYLNERNNQMQGLSMLPTMQNIGYTDSDRLASVGDNFRQYQQDLLNTNYGDWQEYKNYEPQMLDLFGNAMSRTMGAGGSSSAKSSGGYQPSKFAGAIGGGLAGSYFGPLGAGLGALAGLLG
jgi:hypothetical protein